MHGGMTFLVFLNDDVVMTGDNMPKALMDARVQPAHETRPHFRQSIAVIAWGMYALDQP